MSIPAKANSIEKLSQKDEKKMSDLLHECRLLSGQQSFSSVTSFNSYLATLIVERKIYGSYRSF